MMIAISNEHISATIEALAAGEGALKEVALTSPPFLRPQVEKWKLCLEALRKTLEEEVRSKS